MRKYILFAFVFMCNFSFSQFATNFVCNDCDGNKHNLFNELDSGYIIVLDWVMPCGSCIDPSKTVYNIIQSYSDSFPDKIRMYVCDDRADTDCQSIVSWTNNYGMIKTKKFSDTSIIMEDYGLPGMPKVVIIGNKSHYVYFNEVDFEAGNIQKLKNAFNDALSGKASIKRFEKQNKQIFLTENFVEKKHYLNFNILKPETFIIKITDISGKNIAEKTLKIHENKSKIDLNTDEFNNGIYFLNIFNNKTFITLKLNINN
ncbi:MAG: T9SS type A sorting domain-containing protein [Bacteroidetes bacterium]|nr:T9SS type A sorting domain-containing protein [Bacteroidota bacterium]